jgi:multiple sugar transport system ATP-binding protein
MTMGTRIVVMKDGFIQQVDTPQNLYEKPCNLFVAGFIGSPQMNFIDATVVENNGKIALAIGSDNKRYIIDLPEGKVNDALRAKVGQEVIMGIRPEDLHDDEMHISTAGNNVIDCDVEVTELMGHETYLYLALEGEPIVARVNSRSTAKVGDNVKIAINTNRIHVFDKETERAICN